MFSHQTDGLIVVSNNMSYFPKQLWLLIPPYTLTLDQYINLSAMIRAWKHRVRSTQTLRAFISEIIVRIEVVPGRGRVGSGRRRLGGWRRKTHNNTVVQVSVFFFSIEETMDPEAAFWNRTRLILGYIFVLWLFRICKEWKRQCLWAIALLYVKGSNPKKISSN